MNQVGSLNFFQVPQGYQGQQINEYYPNIQNNQREFYRYQLGNQEVQTFQYQDTNQLHTTYFHTCLTNLLQWPNEYNFNKLKEIYYNEPIYQLKLYYQWVIRSNIILDSKIHVNAMGQLIKVLKGRLNIEGEKFGDKYEFFYRLFNVFTERRFPFGYLDYLELIHEMLVQDDRLIKYMSFKEKQFEKIFDSSPYYQKEEVHEIVRIFEKIIIREKVKFTIYQKSNQIIQLFQIASVGQPCVKNAEAIIRLIIILEQTSKQDRVYILSQIKQIIPQQFEILASKNRMPNCVQNALLFCIDNADQADYYSYISSLYTCFDKFSTLQKLDLFQRFWFSIYSREFNLFKIYQGIFWQFGFWYLIESVFQVIRQNYNFVQLNQLMFYYNHTILQSIGSTWNEKSYSQVMYYYNQLEKAKIIIENFYSHFYDQ